MWQETDNKLTNSFKFKDFKLAFKFMTEVAKVADEMDHHPWWSNMYNEVNFELSTHDAGDKVTKKDHALADEIDKIYSQY